MAQEAPARTKIPTKTPQLLHSAAARPAGRPKKGSRTARSWVIASGTGRATTRGSGEVIELECGITVYPAREEQGRWRAVWYENGERRQCEAASLRNGSRLTARRVNGRHRILVIVIRVLARPVGPGVQQ
jgi:hypothetical protein